MLIFLLLFSVDHLILSHSNCFSYCSPPTFALFEMSVIPNSPLFSQQWFWEPPCWGTFQMCVWLWMGDFGLPCSLTPLLPSSGLSAEPSSSSPSLGIWGPGRTTSSWMALRPHQGGFILSVLAWPGLHFSSENELKSPKPPSSSHSGAVSLSFLPSGSNPKSWLIPSKRIENRLKCLGAFSDQRGSPDIYQVLKYFPFISKNFTSKDLHPSQPSPKVWESQLGRILRVLGWQGLDLKGIWVPRVK